MAIFKNYIEISSNELYWNRSPKDFLWYCYEKLIGLFPREGSTNLCMIWRKDLEELTKRAGLELEK